MAHYNIICVFAVISLMCVLKSDPAQVRFSHSIVLATKTCSTLNEFIEFGELFLETVLETDGNSLNVLLN